jgi:methionyl-tRNA synthetase
MITYDDFAKVDIRIGEIMSVEIVEDADKLLKLTVDVRDGINEDGTPLYRQILSGIRTHFEDPQILVGQKYPFVINLEPRTIRGFESHGMIVAASHEGILALLSPTVDIPAGTKLK